MSNLPKLLGSVALLALLGGCTIEAADSEETQTETEDVGISEQEIRNGLWAPLPSADGNVDITVERNVGGLLYRKRGTGMLLGPRWVLTAGHVVDASDIGGAPTQISVTWGHVTDPSAPTRIWQNVYIHPSHTTGGATSPTQPADVDVALIHLSTAFSGAVTRSISTAATSTLAGTTLSCCGYGWTAEVAGSHGILHCGAMPVSATNTNYVTLIPNALSQIPLQGDSGTSCIDVFGGAGVSGVVTAVSGSPVNAGYVVPADRFRTWVQTTMTTVGP
ncbi:trypsin-like serine protease [Polyangium sp. y55x31]|uniref:trypsin-like serine protease n=1 Tax=Polyangium sp. y55x31 TaxID=3042688 RepID=UPI002482C65F|nr:trypsin-like serine protease [Polyangium sp. y55x31]MDI1482974.1 trypsin-like serine protease [Polyangium sp. y55x31]